MAARALSTSLQTLAVMLAVAMIAFVLTRYVGNPLVNMVGAESSIEDRQKLRSELGLNDPLPRQFMRFAADAAQGHFGVSYRFQRPVGELIAERLPATLELVAVALLLALVLGVQLGVFAAVQRDAAARREQIMPTGGSLRRISVAIRVGAATALLLTLAALIVGGWGFWIGAATAYAVVASCMVQAQRRLAGTRVSARAFIGGALGEVATAPLGAITLVGMSLPTFVIGIALIYVFSVNLQALPAFGRGDVVDIGDWTSGLFTASGLKSVLMPAVTLGFYQFAIVTRLMRTEMETVLRQDHIKFARARGVGEFAIIFGQALPNSILPMVTVLGPQVAGLIAFSVVTETVFQWPGVGFLFMQAVQGADVPLMSAYLVISSVGFVTMNLLVDVFYAAMDPRLRAGNREATA